MNSTKSLINQTFIYGLATVLPRMFTFLLVPLYTDVLSNKDYGLITIVFSYVIFFNVVLSYGMETTFFRFFHKSEQKEDIRATAQWSVFVSSLVFLVLALIFHKTIASGISVSTEIVRYAIWILFFDSLVVVPFALLRAQKKALTFALIKIANVGIMLGLNIFLLIFLPKLALNNSEFWPIWLREDKIAYVFIANLVASGVTLLVFLPKYFNLQGVFSFKTWQQMMRYGIPILLAGLAFAINEHFDKILLKILHVPLHQIGAYSACYKIGVFMVLFRTAFSLGIEPFFFSQAQEKNAPETYANISKYFVILGSLIMFIVILMADIIKPIMIRNPSYWEAMSIVPLIVMANFLLGIYTNLSVWYKVIDKTWIGAFISVLGALVTIGINFWTIPALGYVGSAIATILAYGLMALISYYWGQKKYPIPYPKFDMVLYITVSTVFSGVYFYLFRENYTIGSLFFIILLALVFFKEKNNFQKLLWNKTP